MALGTKLLNRMERLVRANQSQCEQIRVLADENYKLKTAPDDKRAAWSPVSQEQYDQVKQELDEALERGVAIAKQRSELRTLTGCAEGQELEDRVRELVIFGKNYGQVVNEREDALERHKQAHDRAMALHVVIDQAVHELRDMDRLVPHKAVQEAIHLLTREDLAGEAKDELAQLRSESAAAKAAREQIEEILTASVKDRSTLDKIREYLGPASWDGLIPALQLLVANAANWEAEAKERAQSAEAWEKTARALNGRIDQAVAALDAATHHSRYGGAIEEARSLLTSDAGMDPNRTDEEGE